MQISYSWLNEYLNTKLEINELSQILTDIGLEVGGIEEIESIKGGLRGLVIGEVLTCEQHPNADKLSKTTVNVGKENPLNIVCGAPNIAAGQKVIVATVGTTLYDGDESFKIKKSKIRGELSEGMVCAEDEIGVGSSHDGIMVLPTEAIPGTEASDYFKVESDFAIEIDLTPNRIDGASHIGVARDLAAYLKQQQTEVDYNWPSVDAFKVENTSYPVSVEVENNEACIRYSGVTLSGVEVKDSPEWLQNKIKAIGLAPINNIVDVTNFVLHESGQPLHAFDGDEITGDKVQVKTLANETPFVTLDEQERKLSDKDLMICNAEAGMCIAGVFGGATSGVKASTSKIFLESACFNPVWVRKTAKRHTLSTDASFRFERGTDVNKTIWALKRAALLIKEVAGGSISSEVIDIYPEEVAPYEISVSYKNIIRLIGKEIALENVKSILTALEIEIVSEENDTLNLLVPTYRVDVRREADIVEEILRIYGYNNIDFSADVKSTLIYFDKPDDHKMKNLVSEMMIGAGYTEIMNNSLTKKENYDLLSEVDASSVVEIFNPLSIDLNAMRQSLLFGGLETIRFNRSYRNANLHLFEFGNTVSLDPERKDEAKGYKYGQHVGLFVTGNKAAQSWTQPEQKSTFYDLKTAVENLILRVGVPIDVLNVTEAEGDTWGVGIKLSAPGSNMVLAELGKVSGKITDAFDIEDEVYFADIHWDAVLKQSTKHKVLYKEISKFPEVRRDLALLIDKEVSFSTLKTIALKADKKIMKRVSIFDVYEGKNLPAGKKSYALSFILQDSDKTLNDKQIDKLMKKLQGAFKHQVGAELR